MLAEKAQAQPEANKPMRKQKTLVQKPHAEAKEVYYYPD